MRIAITTTLLLCLTLTFPANAQQDSPPLINSENVTQLQSIVTLDFADGFRPIRLRGFNETDEQATAYAPELRYADFDSGWFATDNTADKFAIVTDDNEVLVIDRDGDLRFTMSPPLFEGTPATLVDAVFGTTSIGLPLFALYSSPNGYRISIDDGQIYGGSQVSLRVESGRGESVWVECEEVTYYTCKPYVEVIMPGGETQIVGFPNQLEIEFPDSDALIYTHDELVRIAYPADRDAMVRIGRIEPPFSITSSPEGLVKRWDLQTGEVTAEAQIENGPAVFGQIDAYGRWLVWRDPTSQNLNLLDFQIGENRVVAPLHGQYVQFFFVGADADVILGVAIEDRPNVVAWIVETGEMIDLGPYRECARLPDMARLSVDGTTLVIGCASGLDIWQVSDA